MRLGGGSNRGLKGKGNDSAERRIFAFHGGNRIFIGWG